MKVAFYGRSKKNNVKKGFGDKKLGGGVDIKRHLEGDYYVCDARLYIVQYYAGPSFCQSVRPSVRPFNCWSVLAHLITFSEKWQLL